MGDKATLAKARRELEDLYLGIPDDSVNLTFQDLAQVQQQHATSSSDKKKPTPVIKDPIPTPKREVLSPSRLTKLPSLDFSRGLEASSHHHQHHQNQNQNHHRQNNHNHHHHHANDGGVHASHGGHGYGHGDHRERGRGHHRDINNHASPYSPRREVGFGHEVEHSVGFDDMSRTSMASMNPFQERGGRRRPGIPHSNICTVCSVYIYMFRHRCLVCGRVYCRQCLSIGMGEMTEGRKCIECLGRRFSPRYIQRAGNVGCWSGCCMRYPSTVKQQELKWAEKGPKKSGENRYGRSGMVSRSRSPMTPRTPTRALATSSPPSFVVNSPYSPYSAADHHIPL